MATDPRTGRPVGDHGTANDAIDFALEHAGMEEREFLDAWRDGSAFDEWPEFYAWLRERDGGTMKAAA